MSPIDFQVVMGEPQVFNDDGLSPKVCNCEVCLLHVLAVSEYDLNLLCDESILIQSSIDIMGWDWVWQRVGFQLVLLDEGAVDKHSCCARVEEGRDGDGLQGGGGSELHGHVEGVGKLRQDV